MMPFRSTIREHLARLASVRIDTIAPSHGPLYRPPDTILAAYRDWTSDEVRNEVVIIYATMHGSTEKMVNHLAGALIERDVTVRVFNLAASDLGEIAMSLVDAATVVIGTPTLLFGPHPLVANAAYITNLLRPKTRFAAVIGSYGWGGNTVDILKGMLPRLTTEMLEPVYVKGTPDAECLRKLESLADLIATKHREIGASSPKDA
jgi:flavorubredoxin